jgi:intracellular septation protein
LNTENLTPAPEPIKPTPKSQALGLFFGGLLPVIAFTVIEEKYGIIAGLIAGMVFGFGEIAYELIKYKKVNTITWIGNGLLIGLGAISLFSTEGIWFKLQPAIFEFGFFIFLLGSWIIKKPFMKLMIEKQNPTAPDFLKDAMGGITFRISFFFLAHAVIATYAALYWSTENWALLKGVGLTVSMILYMVVEMVWLRLKIKTRI